MTTLFRMSRQWLICSLFYSTINVLFSFFGELYIYHSSACNLHSYFLLQSDHNYFLLFILSIVDLHYLSGYSFLINDWLMLLFQLSSSIFLTNIRLALFVQWRLYSSSFLNSIIFAFFIIVKMSKITSIKNSCRIRQLDEERDYGSFFLFRRLSRVRKLVTRVKICETW